MKDNGKYIQFMRMCDKQQIIELLPQIVNEWDMHRLIGKLYEKRSSELLERMEEKTKDIKEKKDSLELCKVLNELSAINRKYDKLYSLCKDVCL